MPRLLRVKIPLSLRPNPFQVRLEGIDAFAKLQVGGGAGEQVPPYRRR